MPTLPSLFPLVILASAGLAVWVGLRLAGDDAERRKAVFPTLVDSLGVGLLTARLGYIAQWWPLYAAEPLSMLRIGDGGFMVWVGVLCGLSFAAWRMQQRPALRRPLAGALLAGSLTALTASAWVMHVDASPERPPALTFDTLSGQPIQLDQPSGKPRVVNVWATWCPPCRRELPALVAARDRHPDIDILLLNQGESPEVVSGFLASAGLPEQDVLLDPESQASAALGVRAYPLTLFYDASGRLVDRHYGELTAGGLAGKLVALEGGGERLGPGQPK